MRSCYSIFGAALLLALPGRGAAQKSALDESIKARAEVSWNLARQIWGWAEPGYQETRSSKLLADTLEAAGFKVERGVAKIPTVRGTPRARTGSRPSALTWFGQSQPLKSRRPTRKTSPNDGAGSSNCRSSPTRKRGLVCACKTRRFDSSKTPTGAARDSVRSIS